MNPLTADVRRLVIAARIVAFEDQGREALKELDAASEAFADRVPWDDEPEQIKIGDRLFRKFVPHPEPITDGTVRCIACGQIDEPEHHDNSLCPATRRET